MARPFAVGWLPLTYRTGIFRREGFGICDKNATKLGKGGGAKCLVDLIGIEPMTSSMPWKRAPSCATGPLLRKDFFHFDGVPLISQRLWELFRYLAVSKEVE